MRAAAIKHPTGNNDFNLTAAQEIRIIIRIIIIRTILDLKGKRRRQIVLFAEDDVVLHHNWLPEFGESLQPAAHGSSQLPLTPTGSLERLNQL